jgi:hypothetical protein
MRSVLTPSRNPNHPPPAMPLITARKTHATVSPAFIDGTLIDDAILWGAVVFAVLVVAVILLEDW